MDLTTLFVSQRQLRNPAQVRDLVAAVLNQDPIPPILVSEDDDGSLQVEDGHHRLVAYRLAGRTTLARAEYVLIVRTRRRPRFGGVDALLRRVTAAR